MLERYMILNLGMLAYPPSYFIEKQKPLALNVHALELLKFTVDLSGKGFYDGPALMYHMNQSCVLIVVAPDGIIK
tara:strand:+ start:1431 stop:1655 length:225 start_codon:yes stop_codon:yes gene_type:complete